MALTSSTLLPSQDALLNRLQHISLYGQQLIVLTGVKGSGKSTLSTALLTQLDAFSSAWVVCPKHCDSAEIRRKILVQLLTEPIFDDETPLPETLLRLSAVLPSAICIVLDDANYIPLEIWAECIVLSRMSFPGKTLNVTLTSTTDFLDEVLQQLPAEQRTLVLPLEIEPITIAEREQLYYSLLNRSEAQPFTPPEIVKDQLEQQDGTPKAVVTLLELALNDDIATAASPSKVMHWIIGVTITLTLLALLWFGVKPNLGFVPTTDVKHTLDGQNSAVVFAGENVFNTPFLQHYAERILKAYKPIEPFQTPQAKTPANYVALAAKLTPASVAAIEPYQQTVVEQRVADQNTQTGSQNALSRTVATHQPLSIAPEKVEMSRHIETFTVTPITALVDSAPQAELTSKPAFAVKPTHGFTLQLASVKQVDSLARILTRLNGETELKVARYQNRWVVLFGHFTYIKQAKEQSLKLTTSYDLPTPWIRKWQDLSQYELQDPLPAREISQ